ncbi:PREDICTED: testis-expressed sequence 38 protein [Gavialis gangeticus]|uniref:testis-expressed sequence 38 protein n=1 Tax=Gavialis gangeticus TaxID=94835 RepID=UPI00092EFB10|nr:PREDICTED: testis-expressed sequence 38 protein [Gavialis gangeticus]
MVIPSSWLPLYFGSIGLCYILLFTCMFLLHWRKVIRRERQAKAWVELVKSEMFFPNPVVHWADKRVNYGIKAEVYAPESSASTKQAGKNSARDDTDGVFVSSQVEADPCKLVFQELPFVRSLSSLPPMVSHSISYPFPAFPSRAVPFTSLPDLDKVEESWHFGSSLTSEM